MGKPPTTDQELQARVAALEERADATDAAVAELRSGLDTAEGDILVLIDRVDQLDARVTALEDLVTVTPSPGPPDGTHPDHELPRPPARPDHTLPVPEPPDVVPPDPPPAGTCRAVLTLHGHDYIYDEAAGSDIGAYADPAGRFSMSCVRTTRDDFPSMRVDFRRISGISGWLCVIFEYGDLWQADEPNLGAYSVTIDGGTAIDLPSHHRFARWRWQSAEWPFPLATIAELTAAKLLPAFSLAPAHGTTEDYADAHRTYEPMGLCGIQPHMESGGDRPDIGMLTDWQGVFVTGLDPTILPMIMGQGEAASGTCPWLYRDINTGAFIDVFDEYPGATTYNPPSSGPYIQAAHSEGFIDIVFTGAPGTYVDHGNFLNDDAATGGTGRQLVFPSLTIPASGSISVWGHNDTDSWMPTSTAPTLSTPVAGITKIEFIADSFAPGTGITLDGAHNPPCNWLPWLLTGDPYFLEGLQCQAVYALIAGPRGPMPPIGFAQINGGSSRGWAWGLRNYMHAAKATPSVTPPWLLPKSKFQHFLDLLGEYYVRDLVNSADPLLSVIHTMTLASGDYSSGPYLAGTWTMMWQEDFCIAVEAWCAMMFGGDWDRVAAWHVQHVIARTDGVSGWGRARPAPYQALMRVQPTDPYLATWEAWRTANWNAEGRPLDEPLDAPLDATPTQYAHVTRAALAMGVQAGRTEAAAPLAWLTSQLTAAYLGAVGGLSAKWCVA